MSKELQDHKDRAHSDYGMSQIARYSVCPGSVRLLRQAPHKGESTIFADEGTAAHELAEWCLRKARKAADYPETHIEVNGNKFAVHDDSDGMSMADYVQQFVNEVNSRVLLPAELLIEHRFALPTVHPSLFGTSDAVIYLKATKRLIVVDLKYGAGKLVIAKNNKQLMGYALGSFMELSARGLDIREIVLVIVQPRKPNAEGITRSWTVTPGELIDFAGQLKDWIDKTLDPDAPLKPGDHCRDTFCGARHFCPAYKQAALEYLPFDLDESGNFVLDPAYDKVDIPALLKARKLIEDFLSQIYQDALAKAIAGDPPEGFKLTLGRPGNAVWLNDEAARAFVIAHKVPLDKALKPATYKTPAQIKSMVKKNELDNELFLGCTMRAAGKPTLVLDTDDASEQVSPLDFVP